MRSNRLRFCIVTTANVADNPRVVKEADALSAVGHQVRVVAHRTTPSQSARDEAVMRDRSWTLDTVAVTRPALHRVAWAYAGVRQHAARRLFAAGVSAASVRDFANGKHTTNFVRHAASAPADVVVAHHVPALPAAARAAVALNAALAYDYEDYYVGNVVGDPAAEEEMRRIDAVERVYVPRCRAIIASTRPIADAVAARYGVRSPTVVLNTFPAAAADALTDVRDVVDDSPSFYWFSQVIGPNRGLEHAVRSLARARVRLQLHLRGALIPGYDRLLCGVAESEGSAATLHFHSPESPDELVAISRQHDVGLSLEQPVSENRLLSAPNKLFTYLLAGNAVIATRTPGQTSALDESRGAAEFIEFEDVDGFAAVARRLASDGAWLATRKRAAREAAARRYSWEHDAPTLVDALERAAL